MVLSNTLIPAFWLGGSSTDKPLTQVTDHYLSSIMELQSLWNSSSFATSGRKVSWRTQSGAAWRLHVCFHKMQTGPFKKAENTSSRKSKLFCQFSWEIQTDYMLCGPFSFCGNLVRQVATSHLPACLPRSVPPNTLRNSEKTNSADESGSFSPHHSRQKLRHSSQQTTSTSSRLCRHSYVEWYFNLAYRA